MKTSNKKTGNRGEDEACLYLLGLGHTVIERNWTSGHLELDIVSVAPDGLHVVEVKTRKEPLQADPLENFDSAKRQNVARAARAYICSDECKALGRDYEIFLDLITVVLDQNENVKNITYHPKAYIPIYV